MKKNSSPLAQMFPLNIFRLLIVSGTFLAILVLLATETSWLIIFGVFSVGLIAFAIAEKPANLLFLLIIIRMSVDYSAEYFRLSIYHNFTLSLSELIGILLALLAGFLLVFHSKKICRREIFIPFGIILGWSLISTSISIAPASSSREILRIIDLLGLTMAGALAIKNSDDFKGLLRTIILSAIIPSLFGIYQLTYGIGFQDESVSIPRIFGTFTHPNVFSLYLCSVVIVTIIYRLSFTKLKKEALLLLLAMTFFLLMLLLTYTRIAWIMLFVFLTLLALYKKRGLIFPLIAVPLLLVMLSGEVRNRMEETIHPPLDSSITWRITLWNDTTRYVSSESKTLAGFGINTFPIVSESIRGLQLGSNDPHNDLVKFYVEGGYLGLTFYIFYMLSILWLLIKLRNNFQSNQDLRLTATLMIFFFLSLQVASLSDNIFKNTPLQWIFWILLGALAALSKKEKN